MERNKVCVPFFCLADQSLSAVQRTSFAVALAERFAGFADVSYPSWKSLFEALSRRRRTGTGRL